MSNQWTNADTGIVIYFLVAIIVFLVLREFFNWYWKINKRVNLQIESIEIQRLILKTLQSKEVQPTIKAKITKGKIRDISNIETFEYNNANDLKKLGKVISIFSLSNHEKMKVQDLMNQGVNVNELIIFNETSKIISKLTLLEWKNKNRDNWIIVNIFAKK